MTSSEDFKRIVEMDDKIRLGEATHEDKVVMIESIRKSRENLCCSCKRESNYPDCGSVEKDFKSKKGFGVTECLRFIKK